MSLFTFNSNAQLVNHSLVVPEFGNGLVKTYMPTTAANIAVNPDYTINLSTLPNGLATAGSPNCVAMFGNDLFVSITAANQRIYKFPNYGQDPAASIANVSQITNAGNDYVGIAFDTSGNLFASEGSYLDTHLVKYTKASNYATRIDLGNGGLTSYFANITFDSSGNLWATDYKNSRVVAILGGDLNSTNAPFHALNTNVVNWTTNGGHTSNLTASLQALSVTKAFAKPEGIAFDSTGKLWIANNNDSGTNAAPTLVGITTQMQSTVLLSSNTDVNPNLTNSIYGFKVYNMPSSVNGRGQFGGMQIDKSIDRIYVNEEISGSGIWIDIATIADTPNDFNAVKLNITSTNPGNGGIYLAASSQILAVDENPIADSFVAIYPNPTADYLHIKNTKNDLRFTYQLYDFSGRLISASTDLLKDEKINLASYQAGTYILKIQTEGKTSQSFKIIKK